MGEWNADPFSDVGPTFFAGEVGDLAVGGIAFEIGDGERCGVRDEAVDGEMPVGEAVGFEAFEGFVFGGGGIGEGLLGDLGGGRIRGLVSGW